VGYGLMRRKKLISPENPTNDQITYRLKILFLPYLSYLISITIPVAIVGEVAILLLTDGRSNLIISTWVIWLLYVSVFPLLLAYLVVKIYDVTLTSDGIHGYDSYFRRKYISWQEINLVRPYYLFGIRCLSIRTANSRNIQLTPRFCQTTQILDRVRELAGEDHILVWALEKELSRPRNEFTKLWLMVIGSIALTISIYLIGGNMYAAEQEKPLEQAIASYVRQHPKTAPNQSAIELQTLMAKLGLSVDAFGDGTEVKVKPDKTAIVEWKAIQNTLDEYSLKQLNKTDSSIEALPNKLSSYLKAHQTDIQAIKTQLINNPIPEWGSDSGWVEKSDPKAGDSFLRSNPINYFTIANIEHVIIINILDKLQTPNPIIYSDLAALEKIQQSLQAQPSLIGQLISRIGEYRISKLVGKLDTVAAGWGDNLFSRDRYKKMYSSIENNSMITVRLLQSSEIFSRILNEFKNPLRFVPGYAHLTRPRVRLAAVKFDREVQKGLAYWSKQNICRTDGKSGMKSTEVAGLEDYRDLSITAPLNLATQYPKVSKSDLLWELTTSVREVKAKLASGENIDLVARGFNLPSKVCPGEKWTATATNGAVEIAFSHPPDWKALSTTSSTSVEPLSYKIKPLNLN
jgi:hypothetical protein